MPGELPVSPLPFSRLPSPPSLVGYFLLEKSDDAFCGGTRCRPLFPNFIGLQTGTVPWATTKAKIRNCDLERSSSQ